MDFRSCPRCGARWLDGQLYWSGTGKKASELDLAGLVCNAVSDPELHQSMQWPRGWRYLG
jgi:hypothetical protein